MPPRPANQIDADLAGLAEDVRIFRNAVEARQALAQQVAKLAQRHAEDASSALDAAETAIAAGRNALHAVDTAQAEIETENSKNCLNHARLHAAQAVASTEINDLKEEWKECRVSIDRFDKLLVDLRKTGFGFVTAIVGGAAFLLTPGKSPVASAPGASGTAVTGTAPSLSDFPAVRLSIFVVIVLLIVGLYLIDRVHQIWLAATVARANYIEGQLPYRITRNISNQLRGREAVLVGCLLYVGLLAVTGFIFVMSFEPTNTLHISWNEFQNYVFYLATGSIALIVTVTIVTWVMGLWRRHQN